MEPEIAWSQSEDPATCARTIQDNIKVSLKKWNLIFWSNRRFGMLETFGDEVNKVWLAQTVGNLLAKGMYVDCIELLNSTLQ